MIADDGSVTVFSSAAQTKAVDFATFAIPLAEGWGSAKSRKFRGAPLASAFRPFSSGDLAVAFESGIAMIPECGSSEDFIACKPTCFAWHPRGRLICFASDNKLFIADAAAPHLTPKCVAFIPHGATSLTWSENGGLAVGGPKRMRIFDAAWNVEVWNPGAITSSWTADGKTLFGASRSAGVFRVLFPSKATTGIVGAKELNDIMVACGGGGNEDKVLQVSSDATGLRLALVFERGINGIAFISILRKSAVVVPFDAPTFCAFSPQGLLAISNGNAVKLVQMAF